MSKKDGNLEIDIFMLEIDDGSKEIDIFREEIVSVC